MQLNIRNLVLLTYALYNYKIILHYSKVNTSQNDYFFMWAHEDLVNLIIPN